MFPPSLPRRFSLFVFLVALVPRLAIMLQPIPTQLPKTLPDDAYYYFLTAQNVLEHQSPSIDGINPSNGWHPLWLVINLAVFAVPVEDPDTSVRLILGVEALLDSLVAVLLYEMGRRYLSGAAAAVGALFYAVNSMPIFQSVNGLETGLSAFLIAMSWALSLLLAKTPRRLTAIAWGAVLGLCFLGRTDSLLIVAWLGLFVWLKLPREIRLPLTILAGSVAIIVISPWLIWNQGMFGSPLTQVSGVAVPWAAQARHSVFNPDEPLWKLSLKVISEPAQWLRGDYLGTPPLIGFILWPLGLLGLGWARGESRRLAAISLLLLAGSISLVLVHTLVRWYPRPWYFVVAGQSLALATALLWDTVQRPLLKTIVLVAVLVTMVVFGFLAWQVGYSPWQTIHQYSAAQWLKANTPEDALVASMNAGILGFYSDRTVVNLDGVVNPQAFTAIQQNRLFNYIQELGVDFYLDPDHALHNEYGIFMGSDYQRGLREIAVTGEAYPGLGLYRVYQVMKDE